MVMSASLHLVKVQEAGQKPKTISFMHYTLSMAKVQWALKTKQHKIRRGDSAQLGSKSRSVVPDNSTSNSDVDLQKRIVKKKTMQIK